MFGNFWTMIRVKIQSLKTDSNVHMFKKAKPAQIWKSYIIAWFTINFNGRLRALNEYYAWGSLGRWGQSLELHSLQFWDHVLKQLDVDRYVLP